MLLSTEYLSRCYFWHYTKIKWADSILKNGYFYVNCIAEMNDRDEKKLHGGEEHKVHILCFCNCNAEKIPMWYLYSGIDGRGAAVGISSKYMKSFLKQIEVYEDKGLLNKLKWDEDYSIEYGYVFYQKASDKKSVYYRSKWYEMDDSECDSFNKDNYFLKSYPWEYEKEFRIVIKTKSEEMNGKPVYIRLPESYIANMRLRFAPEIKKVDRDMERRFTGLKKIPEDNTTYSKLNIRMNLMKNAKEVIFEDMKYRAKNKQNPQLKGKRFREEK